MKLFNLKQRAWQLGIALLEDNIFPAKLLPSGSEQTERRKSVRVSVSVPLRFRRKGSKTSWQAGDSVDVSNTGVRMAMPSQVEIGEEIQLDVQLPGAKKRIHLDGVVMWVAPSRRADGMAECGVAFKNLKHVTKKDKLITFIADQLCHLAIEKSPADLTARPAETFEDFEKAFRLIYKEYAVRGYCKEHPTRMHYNAYVLFPGSRTFLLERMGDLLGTISLIADSPCGFPMESLFPEPISKLRKHGARLAEVGLLTLNQEAFKKRTFSLTDFEKLTGAFRLFKILFDYAQETNVTDLVIGVHPKHQDLYHYLTFEALSEPLPYSGACGKPALPMRLNIAKTKKNLPPQKSLARYFFGRKTPPEVIQKHLRWNATVLKKLLFGALELWNTLPEEHRDYLTRCYPELLDIRNIYLRSKKKS